MFNYKTCLFAIFMFVCLAVAQEQQPQPQQNGMMTTGPQATGAATCNFTTVKPTPQTKSYIFQPCIVAKFAAYLSIGQGKYIELNDGTVDSNHSRCDNATVVDPMLVVTFPCGQIEFQISRNSNDSKIFIKAINGSYKIADSNPITFSNSTPSFETSGTGRYYKCNAEQSIPFTTSANTTDETHLELSNFAYEAYRTATGTDFYKIPEECALDVGQVSDLVRIGVGICLVALVVIVLIAYFVGRRRWSERSSYESV